MVIIVATIKDTILNSITPFHSLSYKLGGMIGKPDSKSTVREFHIHTPKPHRKSPIPILFLYQRRDRDNHVSLYTHISFSHKKRH